MTSTAKPTKNPPRVTMVHDQVVVRNPVTQKAMLKIPLPTSPKWQQHGIDILLEVVNLWGVTNIDDLLFIVNRWNDDNAMIVAPLGHSQSALVNGSIDGKIIYCDDDSIHKGIQLDHVGDRAQDCMVIGASFGVSVEAPGKVEIVGVRCLNCGTPNNTGSTPDQYGGGYGRWVGNDQAIVSEVDCKYHCRHDGSPHASNQYAGRSVGSVQSNRCAFFGTAHKFYCTRATDGNWTTADCLFSGNQVSIGGGAAGPGTGNCSGNHERMRLMGNAYVQVQPGCSSVHFIDTDTNRQPWLQVDSRQTKDIGWNGSETPGWSGVDLGGMSQSQAVAAGIGPM